MAISGTISGDNLILSTKQPLGVLPIDDWKDVHSADFGTLRDRERRRLHILAAIVRYARANEEVPKEWFKEYDAITKDLALFDEWSRDLNNRMVSEGYIPAQGIEHL